MTKMAFTIIVPIIVLTASRADAQGGAAPYPKMAAMDRYLMTQDAEVAMAKSAAPGPIAKDAEVLVLDGHGYHVAIHGRNGFTCMVLRSWTAGLDDPNFWNPKLRGPICLNPPAVRSYLPRVVARTKLVLAGKTKEQLRGEMQAAFDRKEIPPMETGAVGYMLSKQGYLGDQAGHWHPHIMVWVPYADPKGWGADLPGSTIFVDSDATDRLALIMVPVEKWSDGSPDSGPAESH